MSTTDRPNVGLPVVATRGTLDGRDRCPTCVDVAIAGRG